MENYEIVYLSSLLNEKAGFFIQEELKKYGCPELKMAHGDIFHTLFLDCLTCITDNSILLILICCYGCLCQLVVH